MRYRNNWVPAIVTKTEKVAANVMLIEIDPEDGAEKFTAGSHIDVSVLVNDTLEIRSYSLVGQFVTNKPYTIAVKRLSSSRGGSKYMWSLRKGNRIRISQPANHFELSYAASDYLLIAGGIGITPILGMAGQLVKRKDKNVRMIYLGQSEAEMPFLENLKNTLGDRLYIHYSDKNGYYDTAQILKIANAQTQVYLCGPIGLMNAVRKTWEESPFENANLRYETFGASGLFAPQGFKVRIPRFNKELEVRENQTLLDALEGADIDVMYDCRKGECGLCQVDVLDCSGVIDHRDFFFSEEEKSENKSMCACISRVVNGSIVIDTAYRGNRYPGMKNGSPNCIEVSDGN